MATKAGTHKGIPHTSNNHCDTSSEATKAKGGSNTAIFHFSFLSFNFKSHTPSVSLPPLSKNFALQSEEGTLRVSALVSIFLNL